MSNILNLKTGEPFDPLPRLHHRPESSLAVSSSEHSGRARGMLLAAKSFYIGGNKLPYDAQISFLRSTGVEYIDTGYSPSNTDMAFEVSFSIPSVPSSAFYPFGTDGSGNTRFSIGIVNNGTSAEARIGNYHTVDNANIGFKYKVKIDSITGKAYVDDKLAWTSTYNRSNTSFYTKNALVFSSSSPTYDVRPSSPTTVYSFKMWDDETLVRDMVPVRKGQIGYLYDNVQRELMGNLSGKGAFVLGDDV